MTKEDIFSKIQIVDYNNILENILDKKDFSEDVKNLLLSMLYKIENGYEDYQSIKVSAMPKKIFIKKLIQIIDEKVEKIELVRPMSFQSVDLEKQKSNFIVYRDKKLIKVYQNERMVLEALIAIDNNGLVIDDKKYELYGNAIKNILVNGNIMNNSEVIRDFNGWSWDITVNQLNNKNINVIFQNLLILLGDEFIQKWLNNNVKQDDIEVPNNEILRSKYSNKFGITKEDMIEDNAEDYFEEMKIILKEKYGEDNAKNFVNQLIKSAIVIETNSNNNQKSKILQEQKQIKKELDSMKDNKKYLENLFETKKEITAKIREIDTFLSNDKLLKEEYIKRNSKLVNEDKIFSISHLAIMLEKERENYLKEIKNINKKMEPKVFVSYKEELQEQYDFFKDMDIQDDMEAIEEKQIDNLQFKFLNCLDYKIKNTEDKDELLKILFELRYYNFIPYRKGNIGTNQKIIEQLNEVEKHLINKLCVNNYIISFSVNEELNYNLLKYLFNCKIANLQNVIYVLKYNKGILKVQINDGKIEEETKEIEIKKKVELNIKLNKKIKVFE